MSLRAILDSSPVAIPPVRPLKRSASLASLPTPPRTYHKRSLSRSHSHAQDTDSDSSEGDGDEGEQSGADDGRLVLGSKKRRTSLQKNGQEIEEEENEFWMNNKAGTNASSKNNNKIASSKSQTTTPRSPSSSVSPAPLLYRLTHRALVSPPPSRRQSQSQSRHISPPVTPKRQASSRTKGSDPIRDSPNNPFLVDTPLPVSPSDILKLESPHTPSPMDFMEKPTITYVLYVPLSFP
jgi:hypothetical protein